jgi:hypothetical protein
LRGAYMDVATSILQPPPTIEGELARGTRPG